jgi:hypothetical protein
VSQRPAQYKNYKRKERIGVIKVIYNAVSAGIKWRAEIIYSLNAVLVVEFGSFV